MNEIKRLLDKPEFPRSMKYDPQWMLENQMGPNVLWLTEWLSEALPIEPGMRVLDLGCGKALSSIFLAKEFGVRVWATDWWIGPDHNWRRAVEAGVADRVCPVRAESHQLPFAAGFFDAIVSLDAYQYFGADLLYMSYLSCFLREGGRLGIVVPGLTESFGKEVPAHLTTPQANGKPFWEPECRSFQPAAWWRELWEYSDKLDDIQTALQPDGWRHWRDFERAMELAGTNIFPVDVEALERDQGKYICFVRVTARRNAAPNVNLYDPAMCVRLGVDK